MSSKVDFPKDPNSPDSIQILIDVCEETRDHHHHQHHHHQQQQQQSNAHQSKQQFSKLKQQQQPQKQHQNSIVASGKTPTDASGGNGYLGVQENFKRERRNSWCTSRPSETLANLKRKWFAGLTGNGNVKALTGDDNEATEPDKSKSHSLTSLDGEGSISEEEKLSADQKDTTEFLDRPSSSTLCSSPVPGYRGDDRFLGDDLFSGRNARSEQDVRGHEEKVMEDKLIEVPNLPQLMGERFSLESDNLFAVQTKKMASSASTDVQASSPQEVGKRCTSPTPLRGCPDKVNRSDHPNLDLLVARHKSEGSLQRYPFKELKLSSAAQRKSSVLSKINSYRNSKKNNKAPPVETHNFVSISSSLSSSSTVSHFSAISPSSVCEVCNKPFTNRKIPLKCLDCGLLTHQDNSCKEQAVTYTCSADEPRTISNAAKSEEVSDPNVKLNKGNSSATTTESDSLDLPDLSLDETDAVFVSPCPPGSSTTGTGSNTTGTCSTTGIPTLIGGNDDEEAWSLTVDEHVINSMSQSEIKRQNLIWELIRNEKHHYRILKMMLKIFVSGLKTEVGLDSAMVNQLFPGLDGLIVVHGHILKALLKQQSIRQDRRVDDLSSVLLEQFGGSNGHQMEVLYGEFCSQHERAINLYKELRRCDRKFQTFINKCVGIVACERRGIDSCILTVTQRLTKYPLLVDQILKYTEDEKESKGLSDFLHLVRSIISAVNDRVDFVAKKERFEEIFDKLDPKSTTTLGSRTIKKVDILAMEKYLRFHGWIKLKTARGRTVDSLVVVLTDWVVMLSENNHKYYFCNIDNKSSMIPLSQLLVREKDDKHEGRNFFLISSNRDAPAEMYELVCKSNSELKYWTSVLRQATALCASKTGTPLDLMSLVKSDQTQLISLIETMQTRDEEVKTSLNQKLSAVEEFYKTLDKLLPSNNMSDAIKQMALAKRQHLSPEDLVLSVHGQETNLIASLQCGAVSDPARRSLSKDRESSSLESLNSRRTSTASLFSKVSHSSSFRNIADPSLSSSTDPSLHHSSSDGVDCDGMEQVETAKVKRKTSDASVVDTKYSARATMGMLPGFLSIFCKEKDDSQDADELHKHRKQSSLTLQQQSFNNSFQQQQQQQQQPQQLPVQTVLQQQSNLQHTGQQNNKISTSNTSEQQQPTVNNNSSENYSIHKQNLSSEAEERLCNFLNSVHNLSAMVLEMSTEAKKKEVQIICMTRQLEKFEKQSYPMDQQMEELRSVQNQVQLEKFQLQELRSKHQEEVDKLNEDLKQQNATFELQRAEIKSQKDELQRQRDALQRQIDLFEEHKSSFSVRQQQQQQHQQQQQQHQQQQQLSKDQQDENGSLKSLKRHERNHSNPFSLAGKPLSAIIADSAHSSRSGSPCRNAPTFSQHQGSHSNNSTMTRPQQQQQQQQNNKQVRVGLTSELFEPPVDEKNGVLVTKKDAVPLLPVHLVSAKNESKLDRHTSAIVADDSAQQLTQLGPVKQMFPAKLATTPTSNQSKQKQQTTTATTTNNNSNRSSNKIASKQSVVSKADDKRQSEVEASKPTPSMLFHNRPENHTITGSTLPLHLAEKTRILPSSSSSSLQHCHFNNNNNNNNNNKSSSSSNSLEDENRQQHPSNISNSCTNGNSSNPKTGRSLFGTTKKLSQLLSPSSSSSSSPPPPPPPQSALEAMMTSALLSPRVQFLSFPNFSGQITPSSPPLPSSSSTPPLQSSSSSSLPSSSSSSSSSTVTNSFKPKTTTTRTSTAKTTTKAAAGGSDDDEIIFI